MEEQTLKSYDISTFRSFKFLSDIGFIFVYRKNTFASI